MDEWNVGTMEFNTKLTQLMSCQRIQFYNYGKSRHENLVHDFFVAACPPFFWRESLMTLLI